MEKMTPTEERIIKIIDDNLVRGNVEIKRTDKFEDLGADSLDAVGIVMDIEIEFGIFLEEEEEEKLSKETIENVSKYIEEKIKEENNARKEKES